MNSPRVVQPSGRKRIKRITQLLALTVCTVGLLYLWCMWSRSAYILQVSEAEARQRIEDLGGTFLTDSEGYVADVSFGGTSIRDDDLAVLLSLSKMDVLNLRGTDVTDAATDVLCQCGRLVSRQS
jgi:hypothetical protein